MEKKRSNFSSGIGFVLAAAGSAVGLGNLWRFPYLAAQYGGGIFILVYILLSLTFGFALMTTEIAIGRKTKKSPIEAYGCLNKKISFIGILATIIPIIILPYYSVIGGWVLKYTTIYLTGQGTKAASSDYFSSFISDSSSSFLFFFIFLTMTLAVVLFGVKNGIERMSKVLMPLLVILMILICVHVALLPDALEGIKYYLLPKFDKFSFKTLCAAMGQMFYSMSLAMGIMITYGSYTKDNVNMNKCVAQIELFDTVIAILAGFMIIPAVYLFSGEEGTASKGAGLMFMSLPSIFEQMYAGKIIGLVFFILVLFAALTSSVSIMEAITSCIMDKLHLSRKKACLLCYGIALLMGCPSVLGYGVWSHITLLGFDFLDFFDFISNSILMPIVACLTTLSIGWLIGTKVITDEATKNQESFHRKKLYDVMIKYIAPVLLIIILVSSILDALGIYKM